MINRYSASWLAWLGTRQALWLILLAAVLLHLPAFWSSHFFADDLIQHFVFQGDAELEQRGFAGDGTPGSLGYALANQFQFFNPQQAQYAALRESGALPWWLPQQAQIHFWRPLSSLSHWLDYQWWPDNIRLMHAHNMLILLLFWLACAACYRRLLPAAAAQLALLLVVLDVSVIFPLDWIAARNSLLLLLLAPLLLMALQRQTIAAYVLALLIYVGALLVAEAGVALLGFVLAWLLFRSTARWRYRLLLLLLFVTLTLIWRIYYQWQGYGALGVSHYIDPLYTPLAFVQHALLHYPLLVLHVISGAEATDFYLRGSGSYVGAAAGYLLLLLPLLVAYRLRIANRQWGFWYTAALLSLLPYTALGLSDPRISLLPFMAYAAALALLVQACWQQTGRDRLSGVFVAVSLLLHVLLSAIALLVWCLSPAGNSDLQDARFNRFDTLAQGRQHVLIVNAVDPFRQLYFPYRAAYHQQALPLSVRALLLAETDVRVQRLSAETYRLTQQHGVLLTPGDMYREGQAYSRGIAGMSWLLTGFFHNGDYRFYPGQRFSYNEAEVTVETLLDGRPYSLIVQLHTDNIRWIFWDWRKRAYQPMADLAVGDQINIQGKHADTE